MSPVDGKVVFITGGARGVGADVARRLRRNNAKLVLTDIDAEPLAELGEDHVLTAVAGVRAAPASAQGGQGRLTTAEPLRSCRPAR